MGCNNVSSCRSICQGGKNSWCYLHEALTVSDQFGTAGEVDVLLAGGREGKQ